MPTFVVTNTSKLIYLELKDLYKTKSTVLYLREQLNILHTKKEYLNALVIPFLHLWLLAVKDYTTSTVHTGGTTVSTVLTNTNWKAKFNYLTVRSSLAKKGIVLDTILTNLNIPE